MSFQIAVDAMGGDYGPAITMPAIVAQASLNSDIHFLVFGHKASCAAYTLPDNIDFHHVEQMIGMNDIPTYALRHGRESSMALSLQAVKTGKAKACITAGNTGALVALSRHILGLCEGIDRPALCKVMPTHLGRSYMLDLGATIECSHEQLVQFAYLGSALFCQNQAVLDQGGAPSPRVKLLNIGSEHFKGMDAIRLAAKKLSSLSGLSYEGYIEGDAIYKGETDIIVCDGFVGNIALKTSEGVAHFMLDSLKTVLKPLIGSSDSQDETTLSMQQSLKQWQAQSDPARYNGAQLLGVNGTVIKSHGSGNERAFSCALDALVSTLKHSNDYSYKELLSHFIH